MSMKRREEEKSTYEKAAQHEVQLLFIETNNNKNQNGKFRRRIRKFEFITKTNQNTAIFSIYEFE